MHKKNVFKDLINAIDKLYDQNITINHNENALNPVSELITPEWHYSRCERIFENTTISYDTLSNSDLVLSVSKRIGNLKPFEYSSMGFESTLNCWYQPFHFTPREKWGIHIRMDSWMKISSLFFNKCPELIHKEIESVTSGFFYFFIHCLFHSKVENAASTIELVTGNPRIYSDYYRNVYSETFNTQYCLEEILGNSYLYKQSKNFFIDTVFIEEIFSLQGPGYSDYVDIIGNSNYVDKIRLLLSQIQFGTTTPASVYPIENLIDYSDLHGNQFIHDIPIWLHDRPMPMYGSMSPI